MGGSKAPKAEASKAESVTEGLRDFRVSSEGFGSSRTNRNGSRLTTATKLTPRVSNINTIAQTGLRDRLTELNRPLEQDLARIDQGQNAFYNYQSELNDRMLQSGIGDLTARMSRSGLENSTVRGGYEGQLTRDAILTDLATRQATIDQMRQQALATAGLNSNVTNQIFGLQQALGGMSNQNYFNSAQLTDNIRAQNAQMETQTAMQNAQLQQQANQAKQQMWGNLIGGAMSLATIPLTGGLSGIGALGGALGGASKGLAAGGALSNLGSDLRGSSSSPFMGSLY